MGTGTDAGRLGRDSSERDRQVIGIPLGLLYTNAGEWFIHKHVLHGLGRDPSSFWAFHWHEHHRESRTRGFRDPAYDRERLGWDARGKEAAALAFAAAVHLPLLPLAPFFTATVVYSIGRYYRDHRRSHRDPDWAKRHLPWHYDHHMAPDQDANWCVTRPWFDDWAGTRRPYLGTERERKDNARLARNRAESRGAC